VRFAILDGKKVEATPKAKGICPNCESELIARCGQVRVWHWAHKGNPPCDPWWENETEWHRAWKGYFPVDWQEVIFQAKSGEKHIADVKTDQGWVIEFQHSYLKPEERQARDAFYQKLVWVVDGARRKRDKSQFFQALKDGARISEKPLILKAFSDECVLLREWAGCRAPVFIDFGKDNKSEGARLWCLLPGSPNGWAYIAVFTRPGLIKLHRDGAKQIGQDFAESLKILSKIVTADIALRRRAQKQNQLALQARNSRSRRPQSFRQYLARKQRARSRRRF